MSENALTLGFNRKIDAELKKWKASANRKPLVLRGARQVGKTTAVKRFAANFETFIYLNMDVAGDKSLFENDLGIKELFQMICFEKNISPKGETLLFIDEIQNCPNAVAMMRYFFEEMPELFVISAGSLLEIMMDMHKISFPVGRVEYRYMFPLCFEEFLDAMGENQALEYYRQTPPPAFAHKKLSELFRLYTFVGGMPEALSRYKTTGDFLEVAAVYENLFLSFKDDVTKYAKNTGETNIIRHVIETSPAETGKRITFEKFGNSGYKSKEIGNALRTLERAMILYLRYPVTDYSLPFIPDLKLKPRLQFLDSGLLNHALGITGFYFKEDSLSSIYKGILAEQIVAQELLSQTCMRLEKPLFWVREKKQSNAELDFLIVKNTDLVPLEVKSGKTGTLRSLHSYIENSGANLAVRLYDGEYSVEHASTPMQKKPYTLLNLPLYLARRVLDFL
ncbi:MAG: ATP-binding protein [Treponema sp.]|nr:ATP-binding protein [Treponema sp.]